MQLPHACAQQRGKNDDPDFQVPEEEEGGSQYEQATEDHRCIEDRCRWLVTDAVRGTGCSKIADLAVRGAVYRAGRISLR